MAKTIHNITIALLLLFLAGIPSNALADDNPKTQIEVEQNSISVSCSGKTLSIKNADHMILEVFSLTGEKVYTMRIDSSSKSIDLDELGRGCYIVRIGKYTRKIYIR